MCTVLKFEYFLLEQLDPAVGLCDPVTPQREITPFSSTATDRSRDLKFRKLEGSTSWEDDTLIGEERIYFMLNQSVPLNNIWTGNLISCSQVFFFLNYYIVTCIT